MYEQATFNVSLTNPNLTSLQLAIKFSIPEEPTLVTPNNSKRQLEVNTTRSPLFTHKHSTLSKGVQQKLGLTRVPTTQTLCALSMYFQSTALAAVLQLPAFCTAHTV